MAEFRMPSLGADMDYGTVIAWHVGVGDHVTRGQVVAEVDTDKSVIEVEVFTTGTVTELLVAEGERVPVGTPLATIADDASPGGDASASGTAPPAGPPAAAPATEPPPPRGDIVPEPPRERRVSPLARRQATELGLDLATVTGTGPGGAITSDDVARAVSARPSLPTVEAPTTAPLSGAERQAALRRAIAAAMARSKREIPHYYLTAQIDVGRAMGWLDARNAGVPVTARVLPATILLKATALALRKTPDLNGFWIDDTFRPGDGVHLGVAIALRGGGLIAPAIHDADRLSVEELMAALRDLVGRARMGRIRGSEMSDPTVTVTSLGDQGVDVVTPVIYPPQVAIVGFGRIRARAVVEDGVVVPRTTVIASLAADHRASDGHRGALLLTELDRLLQEPEGLESESRRPSLHRAED